MVEYKNKELRLYFISLMDRNNIVQFNWYCFYFSYLYAVFLTYIIILKYQLKERERSEIGMYY